MIFPEVWYFRYYLALEARLDNLVAVEAQNVLAIVAQLRILRDAIPATSQNQDTASAAVWVRNPDELSERIRLYNYQRLQLCDALGVPAGPQLGGRSGGGIKLRV